MKSAWVVRPNAAEFPHENALIDRGALWIGDALCEVEAVVAMHKSANRRTFGRVQALAPPMRTEPILPPAPAASEARESPPAVHEVRFEQVVEIASSAGPRLEIPPPAQPRADTPESSAAPVKDAGEAAHDERVETFVRAITEVARAHGPAETAAHVESLFKFGTPAPFDLNPSAKAALLDGNILEATDGGVHATAWFTRTSSAWQSMLRGDGGNLAECGDSTLDDWTANLIARLVAKPSMASTIRRDLRRRGIAAFGMLES